MAFLARLLVRVFFQEIQVEGAERLPPPPTPVILVANHANGLVDGLVLMANLPRYPRFLGKSTLWKILPLAPFLKLAGVVPVYRIADNTGADRTARNNEAFATAVQLLAAGGVVGIFPEGISHDEGSVQPLRTGAARIALAAIEQGVADLSIVAVGLVYDDKSRFRSRALVRMGSPQPVPAAASVRELTDAIAAQLADVAPMFASRSDELMFERVAAIATRASDGTEDLAAQDTLARALAGADPQALDDLRAATDRYEQDLAMQRLRDQDVAAQGAAVGGSSPTASLVLTAVATPVALAGAALHAVPYGVMKVIGDRPKKEAMRATIKLLGCTGLFATMYTTIGVIVGRRKGAVAGVAAFVAGPASGWVTVWLLERMGRFGGMARAREIVRYRGDAAERLANERAEVVRLARQAAAR
jgi:1-acyl-sn-glycerol-3-phosphate acyltransferase